MPLNTARSRTISRLRSRPMTRRHPWTPRLTQLLAAVFPALLCAPAHAQTLSDETVRLAESGLLLRLPVGAVSESNSWAAASRVLLPDGLGICVLQTRSSTNTELTPAQLADDLILQFQRATGVVNTEGVLVKNTTQTKVLAKQNQLQIAGSPASRFYTSAPALNGPDEARGVTIVRTDPGQFSLIELFTTADLLDRARPFYEAMVDSATLQSLQDLETSRASKIAAGTAVLDALHPQQYAQLIGSFGTRWERLATPAPSGDDADATEHGYRRLTARIGQRGELSDRTDPESWSALEQETGYLLLVDARLLEDGMSVDTRAKYFLSTDRQRESWTISMALRRNGRDPATWTETGVRDGPRVIITVDQTGAETKTVRPTIQGEGYISTLESLILGPLLARSQTPADFAFYAYQSQAERILLRTDEVSYPEGASGPIRVKTRFEENGQTHTALYDPQGLLLRVTRPDGRVWAPTTYDTLVGLWRAKGLPLD